MRVCKAALFGASLGVFATTADLEYAGRPYPPHPVSGNLSVGITSDHDVTASAPSSTTYLDNSRSAPNPAPSPVNISSNDGSVTNSSISNGFVTTHITSELSTSSDSLNPTSSTPVAPLVQSTLLGSPPHDLVNGSSGPSTMEGRPSMRLGSPSNASSSTPFQDSTAPADPQPPPSAILSPDGTRQLVKDPHVFQTHGTMYSIMHFNGTDTMTRFRPNATTSHQTVTTTTVTVDCPVGGQKCYLPDESGRPGQNMSTLTVSRDCTPFADDAQPSTEYHVIYTSTVTFYGNSSRNVPHFSPIETPYYCSPTSDGLISTNSTEAAAVSATRLGMPRPKLLIRPKVTFVTTDKNPSVAFSSDPISESSQTADNPFPDAMAHTTAPSEELMTSATESQPPPTFRITMAGNQVIINSKTFTPGPGVTTAVTVDGGRFTIKPTAVVGEGGTVTKPPPAPTAASVASPTAGFLGGIAIALSGSQAVVAGVAMTIPPQGTTTKIIGDRSITLGPNELAIGSNVLHFVNPSEAPAQPPDALVIGGEMMTAIGSSVVVIHSQTITYGPGIPTVTQVIDGDTITAGPAGVFVHGSTIGGAGAPANEIRLQIVGGATVTKIPPSMAVINGQSFTIGPGATAITTDIAGQVFTIGVSGVTVAGITMTYPFGPQIVTSIVPTGTWLSNFPVRTGAAGDEDSAGRSFRTGHSRTTITMVCIAIGVLISA